MHIRLAPAADPAQVDRQAEAPLEAVGVNLDQARQDLWGPRVIPVLLMAGGQEQADGFVAAVQDESTVEQLLTGSPGLPRPPGRRQARAGPGRQGRPCLCQRRCRLRFHGRRSGPPAPRHSAARSPPAGTPSRGAGAGRAPHGEGPAGAGSGLGARQPVDGPGFDLAQVFEGVAGPWRITATSMSASFSTTCSRGVLKPARAVRPRTHGGRSAPGPRSVSSPFPWTWVTTADGSVSAAPASRRSSAQATSPGSSSATTRTLRNGDSLPR